MNGSWGAAAQLRPWIPRVLLGVGALVLLDWLFTALLLASRPESDTELVVWGSSAILRCLESGTFVRCPGVSRLSLLQYMPTLALRVVGAEDGTILGALTALSALSTIGLLWTMARALRPGPPGAVAVAVAAWLGGYGLWYVNSSFAEPLAALLITLGVVGSHRRRPWLAGVALGAAALSKETAPPFLLAYGALALAIPPPQGVPVRSRRATAGAAIGGVVAAMVINALFNVFRYGGAFNEAYLNPAFHVRRPGLGALYFIAQWVSPNGGVTLFAPTLALVVLTACVAPSPHRWIARSALGLLVALSLGFAGWYSPMGWWGYGSRYLMPWLPPTLLLGLLACPNAWANLVCSLGSRQYFALTVGLAILGLPHAIGVVDGIEYARFCVANPECPGVDVLRDVVGQQRSMVCQLFPHQYFLWVRLISHAPEHLALAVTYVASLTYLLGRARET